MLQLQRRLSHWREALRALGGGGRRSAGTVLVSPAKCRARRPSRQHGGQRLPSVTLVRRTGSLGRAAKPV